MATRMSPRTTPRVRAAGLALAVGADDQDRGSARPRDEPQHHQRPVVRGVEIVQEDDQRSLALPSRRGTPLRRRTAGSGRLGIDRVAGGGGEPLEVAAERTDGLDPGPVGRRAALLPAAARRVPPAALAASRDSSCIRRVLPMPGSPLSRKREPRPSAVWSSAPRSSASSGALPTKGRAPARCGDGRPGPGLSNTTDKSRPRSTACPGAASARLAGLAADLEVDPGRRPA